jgi:hypothetical protein
MRKAGVMRGFLVVAALGALVAGCASPAQRIERKLVEVGVPAGVAACMGTELSERLTTRQLRELDRLSRLPGDALEGEGLSRRSIEAIGRALADAEDPALVREVVRTSVVCLI